MDYFLGDRLWEGVWGGVIAGQRGGGFEQEGEEGVTMAYKEIEHKKDRKTRRGGHLKNKKKAEAGIEGRLR